MIFASCTGEGCKQTLTSIYEAGDAYAGYFERHVCDVCGATTYIQRLSLNGVTLSEAQFNEKVARGEIGAEPSATIKDGVEVPK